MGLLSDDYFDTLTKSSPAPTPQPTPAPAPVKPIIGVDPIQAPVVTDAGEPIRLVGDLSPEDQIKKYGGVVGSPEYQDFKNKELQKPPISASLVGIGTPGLHFSGEMWKQLGSAVGMRFPDDETWDKLSTVDKIATTAKAGTFALGRMIKDLPKEIVKAPFRVATTAVAPWVDLAQGKQGSLESLSQNEVIKLPWLGEIPTVFQSFKQAKDAGMGNLGATLTTIGQSAGDAAIVGSLGEAMTAAFRPRSVLKPGETIQKVEPIRYAMDNSGVFREAPKGSVSEYYSIPKTVAKDKYGGSTNNTFLKITPAGADSVELSVVQTRTGILPKAVDYVKEKLGKPVKTYQGDFGKEIKLESQIIPIRGANLPIRASETVPFQSAPAIPKTIEEFNKLTPDVQNKVFDRMPKLMKEEIYQNDAKASMLTDQRNVELEMLQERVASNPLNMNRKNDRFMFNSKEGELMELGDTKGARSKYIETRMAEAGYSDPAKFVEDYNALQTMKTRIKEIEGEIKTQAKNTRDIKVMDSQIADDILTETEAQKILGNIPPKPLKGFENAPINSEQLATLDKIGEVNKIDPSIREAVIRTVTGKEVIGELTQSDYVKAAQTLARFNDLSRYAPDNGRVNMIKQYASPQRHWMRTYEEKSGIPLYSEVYTPMEDAIRLRDTFRDSYRNQAREIFGKYAESGHGEERRLISAYMRGEVEAITGNSKLSSATKTDLIGIANKLRGIYDKVAPIMDVPTDIFLKDYQPRIQNIGGIYQLYKEGSEIPKELDFFAKFKRKGNFTGVQIDDSLALFDIYINSGSNRTFLNPALERIGSLADTLPETLKGSVKSYVLEKMGYGGRLEQFLDSMVPGINQKLGINLPPDAARQLTNLGLSTVYSGLLSSPATWFRQTFQYPLFGYARLGPKYAAQAIKEGLSKEGFAWADKNGFLTDLGVPYGEELAKDITTGGKLTNVYRKGTQATLKPVSVADNGVRSIIAHQAKFQWEDAISRYNSGKITWPKLEEELDFKSFSPVDQNIVRQKLVAGDMEGAFRHYAREIVDDTNFPYRRGSSARITYGLGGKLGTSLLQWPIEATHTMGSWIKTAAKTGDWSKVIRFVAASSAIQRTMKETFGFDFTKALYLGPFNNFYSPFVKFGLDSINAFTSFMQDNKQDFNKNASSVVKTLKSGGIPAGVEIQNIKKFYRSYDAGPNDEGQYPIMNDQGQIQHYADFYDLFWGQLMGFPTNKKVSESKLTTDIRNAQFDRSQAKEKILELYQQEKFDEANDLILQTGVSIGPADFDKYVIPFNQRTYNNLPASLKVQFAPRVFPDAFAK